MCKIVFRTELLSHSIQLLRKPVAHKWKTPNTMDSSRVKESLSCFVIPLLSPPRIIQPVITHAINMTSIVNIFKPSLLHGNTVFYLHKNNKSIILNQCLILAEFIVFGLEQHWFDTCNNSTFGIWSLETKHNMRKFQSSSWLFTKSCQYGVGWLWFALLLIRFLQYLWIVRH